MNGNINWDWWTGFSNGVLAGVVMACFAVFFAFRHTKKPRQPEG